MDRSFKKSKQIPGLQNEHFIFEMYDHCSLVSTQNYIATVCYTWKACDLTVGALLFSLGLMTTTKSERESEPKRP